VTRLDLLSVGRLEFEAPDINRFPCLRLAYDALRAGESAPVYLNAANEVAVARFLGNRLAFNAIPRIVEKVLERLPSVRVKSVDQIVAADRAARNEAEAASNEAKEFDLSLAQGSGH